MEDDILKEFLAESWENLGRLDSEIVALEKSPRNTDLLGSIFRTIHTIKGTCGFLGLSGLGSVAHSAENVLGRMRDGAMQATPSSISLVLQGIDRIKALLNAIEATGKEPDQDHSSLIGELNALAEGRAGVESSPAEVPPTVVAPAVQKVAVPATSGAAIVEKPAPVAVANPANATTENALEGNGEKKSIADLSIRVHVDVLDRLMNLVGELVLTRNQLLQMVRGEDESKFATPIGHLNRVTTDLQEGVMKTRMQPIGNAWSKLPRLVRDLSQQTGKQIELEMTGAETELDRTVLDAIKDPLTHMVRNSADHGLESTETRRSRGKSEVGKISLNACHEGGHVIICVSDDGAGINLDRVREKAIRTGLINEADAARMSSKEVLELIFRPGFSTAETISAVSGRGVGMDVVKTEIERIGGTVDLSSEPGKGATVRIKIPLTLAIISALVVRSGGLTFAIPQLGVVELVRLAAEDRQKKIERINNNEVFRLRNRLLPLVHLHEVLGMPQDCGSDQDVNIVVVQVGDEQFGLIVSEVFDTEEIVVKPVGNLIKEIEIYQGTTILGDGRVVMILDVTGIASQFTHTANSNPRDQHLEAEAQGNRVTSLLLFEVADGSIMSVPLSLVARLEEFPRTSIERAGDRSVVQYRGNLLPLLPVEGCPESQAEAVQSVIVFSEGKQSMGLLVSRIRDIIEEELVIRMRTQRPGVLGSAIIDGRATDIIDTHYYVSKASPDWFVRASEEVRRNVLVVEDSVFFRQLVTTALEADGCLVESVEHARLAVEKLERGRKYDLIVSDIEMPGMDGFQFAEWVRGRAATSQIPMIALTSLAGTKHEGRAKQVGFNRFLNKFDPRKLLDAAQELTAHHDSVLSLEASA